MSILSAIKLPHLNLPQPAASVLISPWLDTSLSLYTAGGNSVAETDYLNTANTSVPMMFRLFLGGVDESAPDVNPLSRQPGEIKFLNPQLIPTGGAEMAMYGGRQWAALYLLDQGSVSKVHLLSESTGGMIGIAFAARYPDRLLSLTTCATPSHLLASAKAAWALEFKDWPTASRELGARDFGDRVAKMPGGVGQPDPEYQNWWLDQMDLATGEGFARYAEFLSRLDVRTLMGDVRCPMPILAPTRSRNTSLQDQEVVRGMIPGARMVPIDGIGYEIYVDKAGECQSAFLGFIEGIKS
ncbi:Alpha/Beta hydrolase protein [Aspergillus spectabilis]